jgi:hypothetical protein
MTASTIRARASVFKMGDLRDHEVAARSEEFAWPRIAVSTEKAGVETQRSQVNGP